MLYDHRTYTVRPGTMQKQLALYAEQGFDVQRRILGEPVAFLVTESGALNTYVHIWAYEDAGDRARKRAQMQADPAWQAYLAKSAEAGYLIAQENKLMTSAPFLAKRSA